MSTGGRRPRRRRPWGLPTSRPLRTESLEPRLALSAPEAVADQFTVLLGELAVGGAGVLSNDRDADGDALSVVLTRTPANGAVVLEAGGAFRYLPKAGFKGTDSFDYRAVAGGEESAVATVSITVRRGVSILEWGVAAGGNGHAYSQADLDPSFEVARLAAEGLTYRGSSGHLTTITSLAESTWLSDNRQLYSSTRLGGFQDKTALDYSEPAGGWRWVTGEPMTFTAWRPGEPNNWAPAGGEDCLEWEWGGTWNDIPEKYAEAYSVEFEAPQAFAGDDHFSVVKDTALVVAAGKLIANDTPSADTQPTLALVNGPSHGAVTLELDGSFRYTPAAGYAGRDRFTYRLVSPQGQSNAATVELRVGIGDYPTIALPDSYSLSEDRILDASAGVLRNDTDQDGRPLMALLATPPMHGSLELRPDGTFTYQPDWEYSGPDLFTYRATDGHSQSTEVQVTLTIYGVDDATVMRNDAYRVPPEGPLTVSAIAGVLSNDTDVDTPQLQAQLSTPPAFGELEWRLDGSFTYRPGPQFNGVDQFTYYTSDYWTRATVYLLSEFDATRPFAAGDQYGASNYGDPIVVLANSGLLANDVGGSADPLTPILVGAPAHGRVSLADDGSFSYVPRDGFFGVDSFWYQAFDGQRHSPPARVDIQVYEELYLGDVVEWDVSAGGNGSLYAYVPSESSPWWPETGRAYNGRMVHAATLTSAAEREFVAQAFPEARFWLGAFQDTAAADYREPDRGWRWVTGEPWEFTAWAAGQPDDQGATPDFPAHWLASGNEGWIDETSLFGAGALWEVSAASTRRPFVADDLALYSPGVALTVPVKAGLLANDAGLSDDRRVQLVRGPERGELSLNLDGSFEYRPAAGSADHDRFRYSVLQGDVEVGQAEVWLKPASANLAPVSSDDAYQVDEDGLLTVGKRRGVLANDAEWDGAVTLSLVTSPTQGTLEIQPEGGFSYRPNPDFAGSDSFVYRVTDAYGASSVATVSLEIRPINDPTRTSADFYVIPASGQLQVPATTGLLSNDVDVDTANLGALLARAPRHGVLTLGDDGSFSYQADPTYLGSDWFEYQAYDGAEASQPTRVIITPHPIDQRPVALGETFSFEQSDLVVRQVLSNDFDPQGQSLTARLVRAPEHGRITFADDGTFVYLPDAGFEGVDSFLYVAADSALESLPGEVRLEVAAGAAPSFKVWPISIGGNGHAYALQRAPFTPGSQSFVQWGTARSSAMSFRALGATGDLVSITSPEEQAWLKTNFRGFEAAWIGAYRDTVSSEWKWANGDPWQFTAWGNLQPWGDDTLAVLNHVSFQGNWSTAGPSGASAYWLIEVPLPADVHLQAADDVYTHSAGDPIVVAGAAGVLANDWDRPGGVSQLVGGTSHGELTLNPDGSFRYIPNPGFRGRDRFTYKVVGPGGETNVATVWLNSGTNDLPPELADVEYHVGQGETLVAESTSSERDYRQPFDAPNLPAEFEGDRFGVVNGVAKRINWEQDRYNRWLRTRRTDYLAEDFSYEVTFNTEFSKETDLFGASIIGMGSGTFIDGATGRELIDSLFLRFSRADRNGGVVRLEGVWGQTLATLGSIPLAGVHRARIEKLGDQVTFSIDVAYDGVFQADLSHTEPSLAAAVPKLTNANTRLFMVSSVGTDWFDDVAIVNLPRHGLAAEATDPEGGPLAFRVVEAPAHGQLTLSADGTFRYVPQAGFVGVDRFRYTADDGPLTSNPATVTIVVEPRPAAPVAVADEYTVARDGRLDVGGPWTSIKRLALQTAGTVFDPTRGLLWAADPENFAIRSVNPTTGEVGPPISLHRFNYFDDANYPDGPMALSGNGAFLYVTATERTLRVELATGRVEELFAGRARSLVSRPGAADEISADGAVYRNGVKAFNIYGFWGITVAAAAYSPDGQQFASYNGNFSVSTAEGEDYELRYLGQNPPASELSWSRDRLVFQASEVVIDATTFAVLGKLPQRGLNVIDATRDRIYTLRENRIHVTDSRSLELLSSLTVPGAPTVGNSGLVRWGVDGLAFQTADGRFFVLECNTLDGPRGQGVADNDLVSPAEAAVVGLVDPPRHGLLELGPDGAFRYQPAAGFVGQDRFVYRLSNALGASQATVLLNVEAFAAAPRTREDRYEVWQQRTLVASADVGLLANDVDRVSRQLRVKAIVGPSHGALHWQADGSFAYEPELGYSGPDSFQYTASDGHVDTAPTTVHLQVRPAQFEVQLRVVLGRTGADRVTVLPDSISGAAPGDEVYVELWLQDRDPATPWYQLGTFDLRYSADVLTLLGINEGPVFGNSPPGTIDELGPRDADLYAAPGWGRMATLHFRVRGLGPSFISLTPGRYYFSSPWQEIAWSNSSLSTFAGDSNYDNRVDLTDFGVLKGNFGLPSGATAWHGDFDGNGRVDLSDFGILKQNFGEEAIGAATLGAAPVPEPSPLPAALVDGLLRDDGETAPGLFDESDLYWLAWERERLRPEDP